PPINHQTPLPQIQAPVPARRPKKASAVCMTVAWTEFPKSEVGPALYPRWMFDKVYVNGCTGKQACRENRNQFPTHSPPRPNRAPVGTCPSHVRLLGRLSPLTES